MHTDVFRRTKSQRGNTRLAFTPEELARAAKKAIEVLKEEGTQHATFAEIAQKIVALELLYARATTIQVSLTSLGDDHRKFAGLPPRRRLRG